MIKAAIPSHFALLLFCNFKPKTSYKLQSNMGWIYTLVTFAALAFLVQAWLWTKKKQKRLPPGPTGFPIFGSLHLLGKLPHRDLHKLSQKYGAIMSMRLGLVQAIVVSSPAAAEDFLKTHDLNFASRPPHEAAKHFSYQQKNLIFAPYGSYWREMRKMSALKLLSNSKIASFRTIRKEELGLLIDYIKEASKQRVPVDVSGKVSALGADMTCRMVLGKKYMNEEFDERGFKAVIQEAMHLAAVPNIGDYIPQIAGFDLQGLTKRMKAVSKVFDAFLEKIIDEHILNKDENRVMDFVDIMLGHVDSQDNEYRIDRDNIKAIILDMLLASMDTTSTTVEWVLSELLIHPTIMTKLQKELEEKVGMDRIVEESDLEGVEYLDMVIKETFRLHSVAPLLLPHKAIEDCTVSGYFIPKGSHIIINTWTIGRDPSVWEDANNFIPERFAGNDIDIKGGDFRLLPFGSGRRRCPGMQLGMTLVRLMVAQLVHCFDWELPNDMLPSDLDMSEEFGLVTPRSQHLLVIPTYRLRV